MQKELIMRFSFIALIACLALSYALPAKASDDLVDQIRSRGVLRVGFVENPPSQFKDPSSGNWIGHNVDLANELAKQMGVKLEIVEESWATIVPDLVQGRYDLSMTDTVATPKRAMSVLFTEPYMVLGNSFLVRDDSKLQSFADLNSPDVTIAVISGQAAEKIIADDFPKAKIKSLVTDSTFAPHLEVVNGNADAVYTDHSVNLQYLRQNPNSHLKVLGGPNNQHEASGLAFAVPLNQYHFLNMLNVWLSYDRESGKLEALRKYWYEEYTPPK
jgi:ABC-type amino acid transport substrate-binding protein